jgi:hypothetical protein
MPVGTIATSFWHLDPYKIEALDKCLVFLAPTGFLFTTASPVATLAHPTDGLHGIRRILSLLSPFNLRIVGLAYLHLTGNLSLGETLFQAHVTQCLGVCHQLYSGRDRRSRYEIQNT